MQRGAESVVSYINVYSHLLEHEDWQSLITLSGYVHDSRAELVPLSDVCFGIVNQESDQSVVSMVSCEVQSCKFLICWGVSPI